MGVAGSSPARPTKKTMTKIRTITGRVIRMSDPPYKDDYITIKPTEVQRIKIPYTITYTQPWLYYWFGRAYHKCWCMKAHKFLGPIDKLRDLRRKKKAKDEGKPFSWIPIESQRDIRCYELSRKGRIDISRKEGEPESELLS